MRRIAYISGSRADFGLMKSTLQLIHASPNLELAIIVTGMHLDNAYGTTRREIVAANLPIAAEVAIENGVPSGSLTARNIAHMLTGFVDALKRIQPDVLVLLGDRGEMLAGAVAALHLDIPILHIHGGERSGTVDEPIRHAISKMSHLHFVATEESRDRLVRMGEDPARIMVVGAPGLDGIAQVRECDLATLLPRYGIEVAPYALLLYHPVTDELPWIATGIAAMAQALRTHGLQILTLKPNSDAGGHEVLAALEKAASLRQITLVSHIPRSDYLMLLSEAAVLVGNSSSGIIEAASFGTPVVNIGSRQNLRQRNGNIIDVAADNAAIAAAVTEALTRGRAAVDNVYGDGHAGERIYAALSTVDIPQTVAKYNLY